MLPFQPWNSNAARIFSSSIFVSRAPPVVSMPNHTLSVASIKKFLPLSGESFRISTAARMAAYDIFFLIANRLLHFASEICNLDPNMTFGCAKGEQKVSRGPRMQNAGWMVDKERANSSNFGPFWLVGGVSI
jgi:hypothetical protein